MQYSQVPKHLLVCLDACTEHRGSSASMSTWGCNQNATVESSDLSSHSDNRCVSHAAVDCEIFSWLPFSQLTFTFAICRRASVCRLSVTFVHPTQAIKIFGNIFYIIGKTIYPSFLTRRMVGGGRPLLREILGQPTPVGAKAPIFNRYSPVASQP